jgi:excisionase family DNA binding protein
MAIQKLAYTFEEAAEQVGCSVGTLKLAVADGSLTARHVDTECVIRHEDLAAWIGQLPTKPNTGTTAARENPKPIPPEPNKASPLTLPEHEGEWLTAEDLAQQWQIAVGTINNWRSQQKGPEFKRFGGGVVRYHREAVEAWVEKQPSE